MNKTSEKIGILSVSMIVGTAAAINGNIASIAHSFPDVPLSTVELISTIPSFALIISILCSTFISKKVGMKNTILLGTVLCAFSGVIPFFVSEIYTILISRAVFGFGIGLFNSMLVTYITKLYTGEERTQMIGFHQATGSLGGILITFISGQLLKVSWNASFLSYAVGFVSIFLFGIFVRPVTFTEEKKTDEGTSSTVQITPWIVLLFFTYICYMTYGVKISTLIKEAGYGSASTGSYVIMTLCIGSVLAGTYFSKTLKIFKEKLLPLSYAIVAVSMFLLAISTSSTLTLIAGFLSGVGNASIIPFILNRINSSDIRNKPFCSSLVYIATNLGSALAPYGAIVISSLSPFAGISGLFLSLSLLFVFFGIITGIYAFTRK